MVSAQGGKKVKITAVDCQLGSEGVMALAAAVKGPAAAFYTSKTLVVAGNGEDSIAQWSLQEAFTEKRLRPKAPSANVPAWGKE